MGEIYSQILLNRLNEWADNEDKILDSQLGFQKGKSTIDCIFTFHSVIAKTLSSCEKQVGFLQKRKPIRGVQYFPIPIAMNIK